MKVLYGNDEKHCNHWKCKNLNEAEITFEHFKDEYNYVAIVDGAEIIKEENHGM